MSIRVAATQYTVGADLPVNLAKLLQMIEQAAAGGARLVVSPEFANHASMWSDQEHCWSVSVDLEGDWVKAVREHAKRHNIYVVFNVTLRTEYPKVTDTNIFVGPDGEIIGMTSKQVLIGFENDYITPGDEEAKIFDTELGRIGLYSCMDGVIPETTRALAVKGAQVLVNTLNSMALDEASLHIPVRAAENRVWVVASNKSGPIVPDIDLLANLRGMKRHALIAPGEAQIIRPDGTEEAIGGYQTEEVVFAEIEPALADDKGWEDGDLLADRRPDTYGVIATRRLDLATEDPGPVVAGIISVRTDRSPEQVTTRAIDLVEQSVGTGARIVVLPELFPFQPDAIAADPAAALVASRAALDRLVAFAADQGCYLAASLVNERAGRLRHTGYLIGPGGIAGEYDQVHLTRSARAWATAGDAFNIWDTPLGRIGLMLGYDGLFIESAVVLTRLGADIILYPTTWRLGWEVDLGVIERAAENHVNVVAAARFDSPVRRGGLIIPASLLPRGFDGELNPVRPVELPTGRETFLNATIYPARARHKTISGKTDLLGNRQPQLYGPLVAKG